MKKILSYFLCLCMLLGLSGCRAKKNDDDILKFFDAIDTTLQAKSASIDGNITIQNGKNDSQMNVKGEFNQENQLQCAIHLGLEANKNVIDDYLDFYIKDGKTYLKNMSTKSQSLASKIGIKENTKISAYNPFLDLTDKELCEMFTASKHHGDTYTFTLDPSQLSELLDNLGSVNLSEATVKTTFKDKVISMIAIEAKGQESISKKSQDIAFHITLNIHDYNALKKVTYPDDLDSYPTSNEEQA